MCCDNDRTDPIEKGAFGGGCVSKSFDMLRKLTCGDMPVLRDGSISKSFHMLCELTWCVAFYMPGLRDGSECRV